MDVRTSARWFVRLAAEDWTRSLRGLRAPMDSAATLIGRGRRPRHVLGLLVSIPIFALSALIWYLVARIATYGFFWGTGDPYASWGGPTLAGAWVVHAVLALGLVLAAMRALVPLVRLHARLRS